jgi:hypothetical protein
VTSEDIYKLFLAEDFYADAWPPGVDGLTGDASYHSANNFKTDWFSQAKKIGYGETPFWFSINEDGQIDYLCEFYDQHPYFGDEDYTLDWPAMIEWSISEAARIVNATRRDYLSYDTFSFEKRLVYDVLTAEDKAMYDEVIAKVRAFEPYIRTAQEHGYTEMDRMLSVFGAVALDWPELENYLTTYEVIDGDMTTAVESLYFMPWDAEMKPADIDKLQEETEFFDVICDHIIECMPEDLSAYDKYRYLATVISLATNYDYDITGGRQSGTAYGSIVGGYSICQGYSRGFLTLCQKADLWCVTIDGVAGEDFSHMWNMVKLDTGYFHIDITWADELGYPDTEEWFGYFMLTEEEISVDHYIDGETINLYMERMYLT